MTLVTAVGKIPVVAEQTWMANELSKFGLDDLILNWESPHIWERISRIIHDITINENLKKMKEKYLTVYNLENYTSIIQYMMSKFH